MDTHETDQTNIHDASSTFLAAPLTADHEAVEDDSEDLDFWQVQQMLRKELSQLLGGMEKRFRTVLLLRFGLGWSAADVTELLQISYPKLSCLTFGALREYEEHRQARRV